MEDYRGDQYGEYNRRAWKGYDSGENERPQLDASGIAVIALASGIASLIGLIIIWLGKLGQPKEEKKLQQIIAAATAGKLDEWVGKGSSKKVARAMLNTRDRASDVADTVGERAGELSKVAGKRIGQTVDDVTSNREVKKAARQVSDIRDHLAGMIDNIELEKYQGKARKRAATLRKRAEQMLASLEVEDRTGKARKAIQQQAKELGKAIDQANLGDQAGHLAARARDAISSIDLGQTFSDAGDAVSKKAKEIEHDSRGLRRDAGKTASHAADEAGKMAKKAGKQSGSWLGVITDAVGTFFEDFTSKTLPELTRAAGKAGEQVRGQVVLPASDYVRKEAIPNVSDAAGNVADYVRKEAIPNVTDAASNVADYVRKEAIPNVADAASNVAEYVTATALPAAGEFLSETSDRVQKAYREVAPHVGDALGNVGEAVGSAAQNVGEAVGGMFHHNGHHDGLLSNVGGTVGDVAENVGKTTGKALSSAGHATRKATDETVSTIFWIAAAGAALVFLFAPEEQQRDELWRNLQNLFSQGRDLVQEFQGYGNELDA